jgi:hypothetical protein
MGQMLDIPQNFDGAMTSTGQPFGSVLNRSARNAPMAAGAASAATSCPMLNGNMCIIPAFSELAAAGRHHQSGTPPTVSTS